jgi:hypothetical protein
MTNNVHSSPIIIKVENVRQQNMWQMRIAYRILVRKPDGKRPCDRFRGICEDNIKMELYNKI